MKKVLIITYYWPPGSAPGVHRYLKLSKYLLSYGWQPVILTVKNGSYPARDDSLLEEIPSEIHTYRTKTIEPFGLFNFFRGKRSSGAFIGMMGLQTKKKSPLNRISLYIRANWFIPDARKCWNLFAVKKVREIIKKENIKAIITAGPPHSTHLVGLKIYRKYKLPWIADFRDPWINLYYNEFLPRTKKSQRKDKILEDRIVGKADLITVVSPGLEKEFSGRANDIQVVYNGFDNSDWDTVPAAQTNNFIISYTGNFKPRQNIQALWTALKELREENENVKQSLKIHCVGNIDPFVIQNIKTFGLDNCFCEESFIPHNKAVEKMINSNMLLFIIPDTANQQQIITSKIFEYIASKSPILPIGPLDGDAAKILSEAGRDLMIAYEDTFSIKKLIMKYFLDWEQNNHHLFKHKETDISRFSREYSAKQLGSYMNNITNTN